MATGGGGKYDAGECLRMTSVSCVAEPQEAALLCLQAGDLRRFTDLINVRDVEEGGGENGHWINLPVGEQGANLLEMSISLRQPPFTSCLLRAGARQDMVGQGSGLAPLHLAVLAEDLQLLSLLVGDAGADVNLRAADFKRAHTALHMAAEKGATACMKILLEQEEIEVDARDKQGKETPLLLAIKGKKEEVVRLLLEHGASLDVRAGPRSLKEHLQEAFPGLDPSSITVTRRKPVMHNLRDQMFGLVKETELERSDYASKLGTFRTFLRFIWTLKDTSELSSVFDLAVKKGLHEHVELLLRKGAGVDSPGAPVLEAAYQGLHRVLRVLRQGGGSVLLDGAGGRLETGSRETVLHLVLKQQSDGTAGTDYKASLQEVLQWSGVRQLVNRRDDRGNTALHLASHRWGQGTVRSLLELGANIGMKNHWEELAVTRIRPDTLESFLSQFCLQAEGDVMHDDFSISFRYDFLAPSPENLERKYRGEEAGALLGGEGEVRQALPETEPLWHMSQSKEHRHLLKHPVITSFLWFKWQRIRRYFNRNLRFFTLFVYMLTWYIFINFGGKANTEVTSSGVWYLFFILLSVALCFFIVKDWVADYKSFQRDKKTQMEQKIQIKEGSCVRLTSILISSWVEAIFICIMVSLIIFDYHILKALLACFLVLLLFRECLELSVSAKRYLSSFENWTEITIVVLVAVLLVNNRDDFDLNRHLAAISIVLSWAELIVMLGRHPKLKEYNIYVTMFLKVLKTFIFFLAWYSLFIIAFGLGFFILLHKVDDEPVGEDDYVFFNKAWTSLVKTTTMFVGELEFGDIPIDLDSQFAPLAYTFFLSFVFLIVVVLMNLLNGLAVSDTGTIREKAEIFSYRSQVETISTFESMLLGDPFDFLSNVPAVLRSLPSCSLLRQLYRSNTLSRVFTSFGASEILLFYRFIPGKSVTIWPNRAADNYCCLRVDEVGRSIVTAAKEIVSRRKAEQEKEQEGGQVLGKVQELQEQVAGLEGLVRQLISKMDK